MKGTGITMSAFLGPIHYWLYNKIQLQQEIVDEIYLLGEQHGLSLKEECNANFGVFENKPLEEMIDQSNIHGWLQEKVSLVENKYAYTVTSLLSKSPDTLDQLTSILSNKGIELGKLLKDKNTDAKMIYQSITDNLLDGMPCDHANALLEQSEIQVTWKRNVCVHEQYWNEVGGNINLYYLLRDAWIEGFAQESGAVFSKLDAITYCIKNES